MRTQENKEKYREYDHKYYIKNKRPKTKIGQAEAEIDQLKQQLEKVQQENKILKDIRFLERVVPANSQLHQLSNRECYLKGYDNAISETIRIFEESYGKDKVKLITERDELLMDIEKVGGYKFQIEELKQQLEEKQNTIDEINKEFVQAVHDWKALCAKKDKNFQEYRNEVVSNIEKEVYERMRDTVKEYEMQLAEKDKEIELLKHLGNHETATEIFKENAKLIIEKRQLAIQELEKVKNFVDGRTYCADYIKKRIKDLKGE